MNIRPQSKFHHSEKGKNNWWTKYINNILVELYGDKYLSLVYYFQVEVADKRFRNHEYIPIREGTLIARL